jgi:hypothetical protein
MVELASFNEGSYRRVIWLSMGAKFYKPSDKQLLGHLKNARPADPSVEEWVVSDEAVEAAIWVWFKEAEKVAKEYTYFKCLPMPAFAESIHKTVRKSGDLFGAFSSFALERDDKGRIWIVDLLQRFSTWRETHANKKKEGLPDKTYLAASPMSSMVITVDPDTKEEISMNSITITEGSENDMWLLGYKFKGSYNPPEH